MATQTITIRDWHPAKLNDLLEAHWAVRAKMKKADYLTISIIGRNAGISKATTKRRVSLLITLGPRMRGGDPDCFWKSLLDSLVNAGYLVNDSKEWVECSPVKYDRGPKSATTITLEDL